MPTRYRYLWVVLPLLVWSCTQPARRPPRVLPTTGSSNRTAAATTPAPDPADYPSCDSETFRLLTEGLARKATTVRLARDPNDPEVIRDLLAQQRADEALVVLRTIVSAVPERMPSALEAVYGQGVRFFGR